MTGRDRSAPMAIPRRHQLIDEEWATGSSTASCASSTPAYAPHHPRPYGGHLLVGGWLAIAPKVLLATTVLAWLSE
jgi:hypothetical protein